MPPLFAWCSNLREALLIRLWMSRGQFDRVVLLCSHRLERFPDEARTLYRLGRAHFTNKNFLTAFWCLQSAQRRGEEQRLRLPSALHYFLGVCAYRLGRLEEAIKHLEAYRHSVGLLERHLTPSASLAKTCLYLGFAYSRLENHPAARDCLELVWQAVGAEEPTVALQLAALHCATQAPRSLARADELLQTALKRYPREVELLKLHSYICGIRGQWSLALERILLALELRPEDEWSQRQMHFLAQTPHSALSCSPPAHEFSLVDGPVSS